MHLVLRIIAHVLILYTLPCAASVRRGIELTSSSPTLTTPPRYGVTLAPREADGVSQLITCGYQDGNANLPRSAQPGFDCRVDTDHGIWGFCPTTVIAATDCGLAAACFDSGTCTSICKANPGSGLLTITCPVSGKNTAYCSTAMLTFGVDQTYAYVACGNLPKTDHYVVTPTFTPSTTSTSTTSTSTSTLSSTSSKATTSQKITQAPTDESSTSASATKSQTQAQTPAGISSGDSNHTSQSPTPSGGSSSNLGAIIGGVLGGLALLCGSVVAVVFIIKRNRLNNVKKTNGSSSTATFNSPPSISPSTTPFPPAPPYAPQGQYGVQNAYGGPPRPPPAPGLPQQMYQNVYHEADTSAEKYKASFDHNRGYNAYAVELPSGNNN